MTDYYEVLKQCGYRYKNLLDELIEENLYWGWEGSKTNYQEANKLWLVVDKFIAACDKRLPLNELNRQLRYIQGIFISWGLIIDEKEQDYTRPLFRPFDFPEEE